MRTEARKEAASPLPAAGLILAGGESRRFGSPKALVAVEGTLCVRRVSEAALAGGLAPVVAVCPLALRADIAQAVDGLPIQVVARTPEAPSHRGASIAAGLAALGVDPSTGGCVEGRREIGALAVLLADSPFTPPELVADVVAAWRDGRGSIVRPRSPQGPGHPVLFDRVLFGELGAAAARGSGGREVVAQRREALHELWIPDPTLIADFDTPVALNELLAARRQARR